MKFQGLVGLALYLGIGALFHAFMVGPQFDWSSAWTYGWLLGWPVMIFVAFWAVILCLAGVGVAAAATIAILDSGPVTRWRHNRTMKRVRENIARNTKAHT